MSTTVTITNIQEVIDVTTQQTVENITVSVTEQGVAGVGVPTGGTTGQVLTKISADNYDTAWITPSSGGGGGSANTILNGTTDPLSATGADGDFYINTTTDTIFGPKALGAWGVGTSIIGPEGPQGIQGDQGPAGADGLDGRTVLNGTGAPTAGVGVDGDFYIDTSANEIYGPKTAGAWGAGTSLVGPQGEQGIQGIQGEQGIQGPEGSAGADGVTPVSSSGTGTVIPLDNIAGYYGNMATANTATTYTTTGTTLGACAFIRINAATAPTVTGGTLIGDGSNFVANTDMYLNVRYNGQRVEYFYTEY